MRYLVLQICSAQNVLESNVGPRSMRLHVDLRTEIECLETLLQFDGDFISICWIC